MKMKIAMLLALIMLCACTAASAQEYYTLPEIREQAAAGWHETYTDKYGRTIEVDIDIDVFGADKAPVITADVPEFVEYTYDHGSPYDTVVDVKRKGGKRTHAYRTYGKEINLDQAYGAQYGNEMTPREAYDLLKVLFEEHGQGYLANDFMLNPPASFDVVYSKNVSTGGVHRPALYSFELWQQMNGLPIIINSETGFERPKTRSYLPRVYYDVSSEDEYKFFIQPLNPLETLAEDIPLCSVERVIQSIEKEIESGRIQKVTNLWFGYAVYSDPAIRDFRKSVQEEETFYLVPSWVLQCVYSEDPKEYKLDEIDTLNPDNERFGEHIPHKTRVINAQTGVMFDFFDKSRNGGGDGSYQGFIPWDKVQ